MTGNWAFVMLNVHWNKHQGAFSDCNFRTMWTSTFLPNVAHYNLLSTQTSTYCVTVSMFFVGKSTIDNVCPLLQRPSCTEEDSTV